MKCSCQKVENMSLFDAFECRSRRITVSLDKCLSDYVDADVFNRRRRACFRCPDGRKNRESFAGKYNSEQLLS